MGVEYESEGVVDGNGDEVGLKNMGDWGNGGRGKVGLVVGVVEREEMEEGVEDVGDRVGRLGDIMEIDGGFMGGRSFVDEWGIG